jgi:hypothetical protein
MDPRVLEGEDLYDVSRRAVPGVNPSQKGDSMSNRICSMEKDDKTGRREWSGLSSRTESLPRGKRCLQRQTSSGLDGS